ncbi:MAG: DUF2062 domain-containing protein [Pseudomonadota bacterium]
MLNTLTSRLAEGLKRIDGDPHYIGKGMAIGVFIGITPTMPFQTALALALAALLRGSKPAAVLGIWSGNPVTIPLFYAGSYKVGMLILGRASSLSAFQEQTYREIFKAGADICCAMIAGGALLAILPALAAYYITRKIISVMHSHKQLENPLPLNDLNSSPAKK